MANLPTHLIARGLGQVATLQVSPDGPLFRGTISLDQAPQPVRRLFEQFEEYVNGQVFPLADEAEARIEALSLAARFSDGQECPVSDLQVYPSTGRVSFKAASLALNGLASSPGREEAPR